MRTSLALDSDIVALDPAPGGEPTEGERKPPMAPCPSLLIQTTRRSAVSRYGAAFVTLPWAASHLLRPNMTQQDAVFGSLLLLFGLMVAAAAIRAARRDDFRRLLVIDEEGVRLYSARREVLLKWAQLSGCARTEMRRRPGLRLFLRPGVSVGGARDLLDVDFSVAEAPTPSLDLALRACEARLGLARETVVVASPRKSRLPVAAGVAALAFCFAVAFLGRHPLIEEPLRPTDARPGETVMFLGNSRVYGNDLPKMVRDIADSGGSPIRYDMRMRSWLAATFKELWNDQGDREALEKSRGRIILQAESGAFWSESATRDTMYYGEKLIRAAKAGGSRPALIVNWTRGPQFFDGDANASRRYGEYMAHETRALAELNGADVIDIAGAYVEAERLAPDVALTLNGNDPTVDGSYLAALVIYGYLSGADLDKVNWRPFDLDATQAARFKAIAVRHYPRKDGLRGTIDPAYGPG